jgi:hypothetical protein
MTQGDKTMKKWMMAALATLAALFVIPSMASAKQDCSPGSKGGCSWTCKGSSKHVTCNRSGGPQKCYVVEGGKSYDANCSDHSKINLLGNMNLSGVINHDINKRKNKFKALKALAHFQLTKKLNVEINKTRGQINSINRHLSNLLRRRSALLRKMRSLHQKKAKVRKVRR